MSDVGKTRRAVLCGFVGAGLALAACGGGASHSAGATGTAATTTTTVAGRGGGFGAAFTAFTTCMSSHGVTVTLPTRPRGNGGPPSTTPGETRPQRPAGGGGLGFGGGNFADRFKTPPAGVDPTKYNTAYTACMSKLPTGGGGGALNSSAFQAYRSCLQDHGVTLPATGGTGSINRNDPKVQAALKTCQPLLPAGGFGRTTTTTVASA